MPITFTEYVVLAQYKGDDADACEWTVFDGPEAEVKAHRFAHRLSSRGWRHVTIRQCGPIVRRRPGAVPFRPAVESFLDGVMPGIEGS